MANGVYPRIPVQERFEAKIEFDLNGGCWLWGAGCDKDGYGDFWLDQTVKAHRTSWLLYRGPVPNGLFVLHRCDTPACVNPDHLFLGTNLENVADMHAKRRHRALRGSERPNAKLREDQIPEIRRRLASGELAGRIARDYGVTPGPIHQIRKGTHWRHT